MLLFLSFVAGVSQIFGIMMLSILICYLIYAYKAEKRDKSSPGPAGNEMTVHELEAAESDNDMALMPSILISIAGIAMLVFGADLLVEGASNVARSFGVSEAVIGLSLVAVGTSLPEMAAAISAALKKNSDVIIGNILGSNLFNILAILGVASIIKPIPVTGQIADFDILLTAGISVISVAIIFGLKKFGRLTGGFFLIAYIAYISFMYYGGNI